MKMAIFSFQAYEKPFFETHNAAFQHELQYFSPHLTPDTASLAKGFPAVCCFVNDTLSADVIAQLAAQGTKLIALRSAGYNHVDLKAAALQGLTVVRVPAYSPYAVAEHAVGLILALNRKIHRAYNRIREYDFSLHGLMGFDLHGHTVGIIGTGEIGQVFAKIMTGFGCRVIAYDPVKSEACEALGVEYVDLPTLYQTADIISLHCPLNPATHHIIDEAAISQMKPGVILINTSRGAVVDTKAIIKALKTKKIGHLGLDVYEEEEGLFFEDLSDQVIQDDDFARLQTFPNVIITGHQAFFTEEAMNNLAETTLQNVASFETGSGPIFTVDLG